MRHRSLLVAEVMWEIELRYRCMYAKTEPFEGSLRY